MEIDNQSTKWTPRKKNANNKEKWLCLYNQWSFGISRSNIWTLASFISIEIDQCIFFLLFSMVERHNRKKTDFNLILEIRNFFFVQDLYEIKRKKFIDYSSYFLVVVLDICKKKKHTEDIKIDQFLFFLAGFTYKSIIYIYSTIFVLIFWYTPIRW